jgi:muramoyltetrapeptide carboxypeptidase
MNRKEFVSSVVGVSVSSTWSGKPALNFRKEKALPAPETSLPHIPPYLKPGDIIGISCPAGFITLAEIQPAIQQIESWGFKVRIGETVGKRDFTFGGTDAERASDFQQMLDDPSLSAVLCARGGYGSIRMIDSLDFTRFAKKPKWIIGFSDITVIHAHLIRNMNIASIHSKMCNSFPDDWTLAEPIQIETILSIKMALQGNPMNYEVVPNSSNRLGIGEGVLVGGNCKTLETLAGTKSDLPTEDKILFVEDTGEYLYSIDRMFWNLKRTGKLEHLKGLIIGGFKIKPDDPGEEFGKTIVDIVLEKVSSYNFPVCFDFPVGHQKNNYALKCGVMHKLMVASDKVSLQDLNSIHPIQK